MSQDHFLNPLEETTTVKTADPCILVIFGATGDLTARKLFPALYNITKEGLLPPHFACVAFARRDKSHEQFRSEMQDAVGKHSRSLPIDQDLWNTFSEQIFYHRSNFDDEDGYQSLKTHLEELDSKFGTKGNRVFYLATPPSYFPVIIEHLGNNGLIYDPETVKNKWSRVVIEKPFGHDIDSANELQNHVSKYLKEEQMYRIDHWLGKETVQNLLVLRFVNAIFESVWNNHYIDHVQITVAEDTGIGTRGRFWEEAGMLRDIVQNHMMQLLSLVAMEPPVDNSANSIRDEKVKVLQSIRPFTMDSIDTHVIRGQYGPGFIGGEPAKSYRQEEHVSPNSQVETFVAMKLFIDNWRWVGVPFYLRAGKRMPKRATEIAIHFKGVPCILFDQTNHQRHDNVLVIRIQPDEGISLRINSKVPSVNNAQPVKMDFRYGSYFGAAPPEAYERLICDAMIGDCTLFARQDEVLASWNLLTPLIQHWDKTEQEAFPNYAAGTWGPDAADMLLEIDERKWRFV